MGTWSSPYTAEKARKLAELMNKPLVARTAVHKLYDLLGDDLLFDYIAQCKPTTDVRPLVKMRLVHFLEGQDSFFKSWEQEAIKICSRIL